MYALVHSLHALAPAVSICTTLCPRLVFLWHRAVRAFVSDTLFVALARICGVATMSLFWGIFGSVNLYYSMPSFSIFMAQKQYAPSRPMPFSPPLLASAALLRCSVVKKFLAVSICTTLCPRLVFSLLYGTLSYVRLVRAFVSDTLFVALARICGVATMCLTCQKAFALGEKVLRSEG